jgi:hypothetical protein
MTADPATVPASATVTRFLHDLLPWLRHSAFPAVDNGQTVRLMTVRRVNAVPAGRTRMISGYGLTARASDPCTASRMSVPRGCRLPGVEVVLEVDDVVGECDPGDGGGIAAGGASPGPAVGPEVWALS